MDRLVARAWERLVKLEVDLVRPATPSAADEKRRKLVYFVFANLLSVALCAGIFWLFIALPEGTSLDGAMGTIWQFLRRHETVAVLAASLPFFASLLVGQFEMRKARARRQRREADERRAAIEAARVEQESERAARRAR
jgi:hypothetical protein